MSKTGTSPSAAQTVKLMIDGRYVESTTTQWHDVVNPATQVVLARVPSATPDEVDAAVASARRAFDAWRKTPMPVRARMLIRYQQLINDNINELAMILTIEQGKTLADAQAEIIHGIDVVEQAAAIGNLQLGEVASNLATGVDVCTLLQPLGVCVGITPFNFPAMMPLWLFPMAIATGNTFVLKPSEQAPMVTMRLAELALEAGIPGGVLNVVHGGPEVVNALCEHPDVEALSFVGSTDVGRQVYRRASQAGKRVQCTMGARNHAVVLPDADKDQALDALIDSAFGAAGQRCMATSVVVLVGAAEQWIADLVTRASALRVNAGTEESTDIGPVISSRARQRIEAAIRSGQEQGATLELDGRSPRVPGFEAGNFIGPTIFSAVTPGMRVYEEEIFGPVLVIVSVDSLDQAIGLVNSNSNANGAAIFTQSGVAAHRFREAVDVGQVGINIPIPASVSLFSLAGSRVSRRGDPGSYGKQAMTFYTQTKVVTARWRDAGLPIRTVNASIGAL